jgi:hypothetical protein
VFVTSDKENYIDKNVSTTDKKIRVEAFFWYMNCEIYITGTSQPASQKQEWTVQPSLSECNS